MNAVSYRDIDTILVPWAAVHKFHIMTQAKDEETRSISIVAEQGHQFQIFAIPDFENQNTTVRVGSALIKRGDRKHTFSREAKNYRFVNSVLISGLESALDEALAKTQEWCRVLNRNAI